MLPVVHGSPEYFSTFTSDHNSFLISGVCLYVLLFDKHYPRIPERITPIILCDIGGVNTMRETRPMWSFVISPERIKDKEWTTGCSWSKCYYLTMIKRSNKEKTH